MSASSMLHLFNSTRGSALSNLANSDSGLSNL